MNYYIVIVIVALALGAWNLMIAILGLFPQFLSTSVGTLTNVLTKRNVKPRHGPLIPILTSYQYTYTVNGKEYRYSGSECHSERRLFRKTTMVFVKWFPRRAYPNKFKGTTEWALGICYLFAGLSALWAILTS